MKWIQPYPFILLHFQPHCMINYFIQLIIVLSVHLDINQLIKYCGFSTFWFSFEIWRRSRSSTVAAAILINLDLTIDTLYHLRQSTSVWPQEGADRCPCTKQKEKESWRESDRTNQEETLNRGKSATSASERERKIMNKRRMP